MKIIWPPIFRASACVFFPRRGVDIKPDGHQVVHRGGDGRRPPYAAPGAGYDADIMDIEIPVRYLHDIVLPDLRFLDICGHDPPLVLICYSNQAKPVPYFSRPAGCRKILQ